MRTGLSGNTTKIATVILLGDTKIAALLPFGNHARGLVGLKTSRTARHLKTKLGNK